jgi:secretion/DNA translocation related TadE-like protein
VLAAVMVAALAVTATFGVSLGSVVVARHRAQAAADLASLAAANGLAAGPQAACVRAEQIASAMGAAVASCAVSGLDVAVSVEVQTDSRFHRVAHAIARAGPVG